MNETISILTTFGPVVAKTWLADGTIKGYDNAKHYRVEERPVCDIHSLSAALGEIVQDPHTVVVRGKLKPGIDKDYTPRTLLQFAEVPRRWLALDIDNFISILTDPIAEPEQACRDFIEQHLPVEFRQATFHWQLTGSAGKRGAEHVLKVRLWFWLTEARGEPELEAWARGQKIPVDVSVFRTVQCIYSSAPVIKDGAVCPVKQRHGLWRGERDDVELVLTEDMLAAGRQRRAKSRDELTDPTDKPGLIGLFCRLYPPSRVIDEDLCEGAFEWQDDSNVRINWLTSNSGSAGGVCVTDDELHFYCSHNDDPFEGRPQNAWDWVRVHRFGELDEQIDPDAVQWLMSQGGMPSHIAMKEFARALPDVAEELQLQASVAEKQQADDAEQQQAADSDRASRAEQKVQAALDKVVACASPADLERVLCPSLADEDWSDGERERLAKAIQNAFRALTGTGLPVSTARGWLRPPVTGAGGSPDWLGRWVYVKGSDCFMSLDTKETISAKAFDAEHTAAMPLRPGNAALREQASVFAVHSWNIRTVSATMYAPPRGEVFREGPHAWANLFDPGSIPETADQLSEEGRGLARMIESHMRRLVPDQREREILISWLAHQVRSPGVKVRWAPYIWGPEGVGKSFLASVLDSCLGGRANVTRLGGRALTSDFTGWADGKAVTVIEEVHQVGHFYDVPEALKTPISEDVVSIHKKGIDPYDAPNYTNYLIFSNHGDGVPITESDRRYFFIETGITTEDARSLSEEGFFERLFNAVKSMPGQCRRWLLDQPAHAEFQPSGRAPLTAARAKVIELSKSEPQFLVEDLTDGRDVVSSSWLARQLKQMGSDVKTRGLQKVLADAGFEHRTRLRVSSIRHPIWVRKGWNGDEAGLRAGMSWMRLADFDDLEAE